RSTDRRDPSYLVGLRCRTIRSSGFGTAPERIDSSERLSWFAWLARGNGESMRYLIGTIVALVGCVDQAPLQGHGCPCVSGWKCCANNSCVPENAACGVSPDQESHRAVTGSRTLCGYDEDWNEDGAIDATHDVRVDSSGMWQHDEGRRTSDGQLYD